ncbi:Deoxyhypusine synthase, variant 2 [Balamuthia mandrillaris]
MESTSAATAAVFIQSYKMPEGSPTVQGFDFNKGLDYNALLESYLTTGFQATSFGKAVEEVNRMLRWSLNDEPIAEDEDDELRDPTNRKKVRCTIFLGYTSNMISCGVREIIRWLVEHKLVSAVVTTAGGIEEDFIKCFAPTYHGEFSLTGRELRLKGLNRIGNLIIPNDNYCKFEDWLNPVLDAMLEEQKKDGTIWSPSTMIARLGKEIDNPQSVYYWAYKNDIPVFCPAITDGSIGDMIFFHSFRNPGLILDIAQDIRRLNTIAMKAKRSGMIILGGGVVKHHICNANLMRNGADYSVFINTGQEFDGSDSGAKPEEAKSWGKIKLDAQAVKVTFPFLVFSPSFSL